MCHLPGIQRRVYRRNKQEQERINIYKQHIRQFQYQELAVEEHSGNCGDGKFHVSFQQDFSRKNITKKILRKVLHG